MSDYNLIFRGSMEAQADFFVGHDNRQYIAGEGSTGVFTRPTPGTSSQRFHIPRGRLSVDWSMTERIKFSAGWASDLSRPHNRYGNRLEYLDRLFIESDTQYGTLRLGYDKAPFGLEKIAALDTLPVVERSISTYYFSGYTHWGAEDGGRPPGYVCTPLGIGTRRHGIYWYGDGPQIGNGSLSYHLAYTRNPYNPFFSYHSRYSRPQGPNIFGGISYNTDNRQDQWWRAGINMSYLRYGIAYFPIQEREYAPLHAFNPYFIYNTGNSMWSAELFASHGRHGQIQEGNFVDEERAARRSMRTDSSEALGANLTWTYQLPQDWSISSRISYLDTDGAGGTSAFIRDIVAGDRTPIFHGNFDRAASFYIGSKKRVNKNLELLAGYEYITLMDDLDFNFFVDADSGNQIDIGRDPDGNVIEPAQAFALRGDAQRDIHVWRLKLRFLF
ncbi:MAG: hypothetical protein GDA45_02345 [Chromatiales bacterium]|nr:hypothetical protein [Chromatiales bacterium]